MAVGKISRPYSSRTRCKVCNHPGRTEIDAMLLNGTPYDKIAARMQAAHPGAEKLERDNLSRHKKNHLLTRPITVEEVDPATGEKKTGFLVGHLTTAPIVPKDAIPAIEDRISLPDALDIIINVGLRNALLTPDLVTTKDVIAAIEIKRKLGLGGKDEEDFRAAWEALGQKRGELKRKSRRRKVTVTEEEVEVSDAGPEPGEIIDAEVVPELPDEWTPDEWKQLEEPSGSLRIPAPRGDAVRQAKAPGGDE